MSARRARREHIGREIALRLAVRLAALAVIVFAVAFWLERPFLVAALIAGVLTLDAAYSAHTYRQRSLRETERMRKDFLATVSHELRTPLTPIIGFAKLLLRREDISPEVRRQALVSLLDRAEHMQRLVEDLLVASSVDEDGPAATHARREAVDLSDVTERVVRSVRDAHPSRMVWVDENEPVVALADAVRVGQVLNHLLNNAIKYSPPDSVVRVFIGRERDVAQIAVADTGRGIPEDKVTEIFRKFRRLEDPDHMETGGAGVGLFIVDQLVGAMRGSIEVRSRPGYGSIFTVRLPALLTETQAHKAGLHALRPRVS